MKCLGIDTSNYTTSVAIAGKEIQKNIGRLLPVADGEKGLRQSDAVFHHTRALPELFDRLMHENGNDFDAVAVSAWPRRVKDSYMPCFLVGKGTGEMIAAAKGIPLYLFAHQEGHLAAAAYGSGHPEVLLHPFLAWHLSGGTTELIHCEPDGKSGFQVKKIGGTLDISAGQCVDRAGVALGLHFPAGVELEKLSFQGQSPEKYNLSLQNLSFNLSGVENKVQRLIRNGKTPEDVAMFVLTTLRDAVVKTTAAALELFPGLPILCSGGVMSAELLRNSMEERFGAFTAPPASSRDNALGIALLGMRKAEESEICRR